MDFRQLNLSRVEQLRSAVVRPEVELLGPGDKGLELGAGRSLLIGLAIALVMVSIMATTYVWANHALVANNLPWEQVGTSPLTTAVGQSISLDVQQYDSVSDLEAAGRTGSGQQLQFKMINRLPSEDPEGAVPGLALFVLLVAGYLSSTLAMQRTKAAQPTGGSQPFFLRPSRRS
jgi:hypothetical protein